MDDVVRRAAARWPAVPAVYGWLALDRRGEWRLRNPASDAFERIGNATLRAFIARNYAADARGAWYFQNGPQRVYVRLEATPIVYRHQGKGFVDHCGRGAGPIHAAWVDAQGALYLAGAQGFGVLDDRALTEVAALLEDAQGGALDADFEWAALSPGAVWLGTGTGTRLPLGRVARSALEARFGFVADPTA
ncbi:MAG TPA: DUF2946 family protein [Burkholderiales bacterium]|nr:DUF2946 family protein [Burkholderiales bacterium]